MMQAIKISTYGYQLVIVISFFTSQRYNIMAVSTVLCKEVTLTFAIPLKLKLDLLVVAVGSLE
jgi:hypothetical protein